jgi:phage terminase small subunit
MVKKSPPKSQPTITPENNSAGLRDDGGKPKLRPKQKIFIDEYLIDFNATQAAIRAGYSKTSAYAIGEQNLRKHEIQKALGLRLKAREERTEIDQDYVLTTIRDTVERCRAEGNFDPANTLRGCELLGRNLKMFTDKVEGDIKGNVNLIGNFQINLVHPKERPE